mgnify:CR=1 FL=1
MDRESEEWRNKDSRLAILIEKYESILHERYNLEIVRAEREVMADRMSLMDAQLLQVELWEPCFRMRGVAYDADGQAVENFDARISGTNCVLKSSLERPPDYFA